MRHGAKVLITGCGAVAQTLLPLLFRHLPLTPADVTVIDLADRTKQLRGWIEKGLVCVRERVTPTSLSRLLSTHLRPGGLIVDLAWSIDCFEILEWARRHDALYVNAALESWDPSAAMHRKSTLEKASYNDYVRLLALAPSWRDAATAVVDHGLNPGLISHFVKQGLLDIAERAITEEGTSRAERRRLEALIAGRRFAELARALAVRVIHCSEHDTQATARVKPPDEFANTWSVEGMWEEAVAPSELGWGTHERWRPPFAIRPKTGPRNQLILPQMGLNTWVRSWVPDHEIVGMAITHGESFTLSHALTVRQNGKTLYRPTVHYVYLPSAETMASLHELRCRNYELHPKTRVLNHEIVDGEDTVGALIMGHRYRSWWIGSRLGIAEARKHVPGANATELPVAAGVLAAILWMQQNPRRGLCLPEDLPHEEMLRHARPYLGHVESKPVSWTPLDRFRLYFRERAGVQPDWGDPWQFRNFVFQP